MKLKSILLISTMLFINACTDNSVASTTTQFQQLLDEHWQHATKEQVFFRNDPDTFRMNGKLPDMSEAGRTRRAEYNQTLLNRLAEIDLSKLSDADQVTYRLFKYERETEAKSYQNIDHYFPMNYYAGYHSYFAGAPGNMSFLTTKDYDNYLISLADFPRYNQQHIDDLTVAIEKGYTQYCETFKNYHKSISKHIVDNIEDSNFWAPLANIPANFNEQDKLTYQTKAKQLITDVVIPEYKKFYSFFTQDYMNNCRKIAGISSVDGGAEFYEYLINYFTTTDMTADEIHQIGLEEVKRIRQEMQQIIKQVGFKGDFKAFIEFLRTDPQFYATTERDLLEKASYISRKMAAQLPKWFSLLPRTPFDIKSSASGAYYVGSDGTGTTSGTYFLATKNLAAEPLYTLEALTFHEAEPGHHLQGSIAREVDMAEFRKILSHSAFTEGWGLYSEKLGKEMGFYQDPYSDFGRLTYETWRACRLVVDTGIHAKGWTRQQAIDYLAENTALSMPDVIGQIDRYISWPAQALSYKIGEIKMIELRTLAEAELGEQFDVRAFHDQILTNGSLPLALLEELTKDWIMKQKG
ncbi:DUF885 domain-containing protein [Psychrosphaera aquimarina]|uniref:DUF885 domain-containing protein n=1 Tax=Psychrosphaera aquimarina TaxID=2044854 RepID=A0ABU3R144_9GAMM|nr:DUF885 domain-containing protein [Psychrosphaera aquimarina]MDU0113406.1 DUF885 domain-containing protein [Psychrosphaera aquimarina]